MKNLAGPSNTLFEKQISWGKNFKIWGINFCNCLLKLCWIIFHFYQNSQWITSLHKKTIQLIFLVQCLLKAKN